jgi:hypothetical protein
LNQQLKDMETLAGLPIALITKKYIYGAWYYKHKF